MRRSKKNLTAAQALGKTTGRWTDEEHQRFNEGKQNSNLSPIAANDSFVLLSQVLFHFMYPLTQPVIFSPRPLGLRVIRLYVSLGCTCVARAHCWVEIDGADLIIFVV